MKNSKSNWSRYIASLKIISLGLLLFLVGSRQNVNATPISISFQVFYDELSPYGDWIEDPNYGFIWVPYVDQSFQPYSTNGHWVMSTYGNTWVSQYNWGWAPFHYGRWFLVISMVGLGSPDTNGALHGLVGDQVEVITDGFHWVHKGIFTAQLDIMDIHIGFCPKT